MPFEVRSDAVGTVIQRCVRDFDAPYRKMPHGGGCAVTRTRQYLHIAVLGISRSDKLGADGTYSGGRTEYRYEILRNAIHQT